MPQGKARKLLLLGNNNCKEDPRTVPVVKAHRVGRRSARPVEGLLTADYLYPIPAALHTERLLRTASV